MTALTPLAAQSRTTTPADDPEPVRHYRPQEVADLLGISLSSAYELIARGDLPARTVPGSGSGRRSRLRVRADDLARFQNDLPTAKAG